MTSYAVNLARHLYGARETQASAEAVAATLRNLGDLTDDETPSFLAVALFGQS